MPSHVHVLVDPLQEQHKIIQAWKSFTARWMLARNDDLGLGIPGAYRVWMRDYWDRYVRNEKHYSAVVAYIHNNPVKAGLCQGPEEWRWSSGRLGLMADEDVGGPGGGLAPADFT